MSEHDVEYRAIVVRKVGCEIEGKIEVRQAGDILQSLGSDGDADASQAFAVSDTTPLKVRQMSLGVRFPFSAASIRISG